MQVDKLLAASAKAGVLVVEQDGSVLEDSIQDLEEEEWAEFVGSIPWCSGIVDGGWWRVAFAPSTAKGPKFVSTWAFPCDQDLFTM